MLGGKMSVEDSVFVNNEAMQGRGGALLVISGSVDISRSTIDGNHAVQTGGAIHAAGGYVALRDQSELGPNTADLQGNSLLIEPLATVIYFLPALLGRWLAAQDGSGFRLPWQQLAAGEINANYPFLVRLNTSHGPLQKTDESSALPYCAVSQGRGRQHVRCL